MSAPEQPVAPRRRILIVEDDDQVAYVMQHQLGSDYDVTRVPTVRGAKIALAQQTFELIVLDWRLGNELGADLLKALPLQDGLVQPTTIVTSGDTSGELALKLGAASILPKPFKLADLSAAVARLLLGPPNT